MALNEQFERLTSNKEEYDRLYDSDNLYIVWAVEKNDSNLEKFVNAIDSEYYNWRSTLNGKTRREAKLFNNVALMPSMKYSYRFEKYDINDIKAKEQQEILEVLKEGNV